MEDIWRGEVYAPDGKNELERRVIGVALGQWRRREEEEGREELATHSGRLFNASSSQILAEKLLDSSANPPSNTKPA